MAAVKEKAALRELARLHDNSFLGSSAQSKKASVDPTLPQRLRTLFHGEGGALEEAGCGGGRRLVPVYCDPPIYVVPNFLTARELDHFDDLLTRRRAAFKQSHTDGDGERLISKERTSISLALPKSGDAVLRAIEARAAELVGLPSDHVEPLQIVHYSRGARFDMHHDLAPIRIRGEGDAEEGGAESSSSSSNSNSNSRDGVDAVVVGGGRGGSSCKGGAKGSSAGGDGDGGGVSRSGSSGSSSSGSSSSSSSSGGGSGDQGLGRAPCAQAPSTRRLGDEALAALSAKDVTVELTEGPRRLATLFLYLNTLPEGIGHTEFPLLPAELGGHTELRRRGGGGGPFSVRPRCGTALLFCNVDASGAPDVRLCHRACPVPDGHIKFGVNVWVRATHAPCHASPPSPPAVGPSSVLGPAGDAMPGHRPVGLMRAQISALLTVGVVALSHADSV